MATIIFLHGFGVVGDGPYSDALAEAFPDYTVLAPDLPPDPLEAIVAVQKLIAGRRWESEHEFYVVGISLGGFYAAYVSAMNGFPATLINPAFDADTRAADLVGDHANYITGQPFTFHAHYLDVLEAMRTDIEALTKPALVQAVVALDDEVIPSDQMLAYYRGKGVETHAFDGKGHRFEDTSTLVPLIKDHFARHYSETPGLKR
jgi:predicted esterase YcpF (UPF0227 family)